MRITTNMVYSRNITSLNNANERLSTAYEQLQSGDKFKTSGEDPSGMSQKMALTKEIDLFKQYGVNGSLLENSLGHEETVLTALNTAMTSAQTLIQKSNDSAVSADDRLAIASELEGLQKQMFDLMNSKNSQGEFIFGGNQSKTQPFIKDASGNYLFQGDTGQRADQLLTLRPEELNCIFDTLPTEQGAALLSSLSADVAGRLLLRLHASLIGVLQGAIPRRDMLDILRRLGSSERTMLLSRFPEPAQSTFYSLLDWPPESVGANMRHEFLAISDQQTVGSAKQLIHDAWDNAQLFQNLYVVNAEHRLLGSIALKSLLIADPQLPVSDLMDRDTVRINARADQEMAARLLIDRDISTLPVEEKGKLVGIFHVDDAADILELESTEDAEMQGGSSPLDTPYLQATPWQLWRKRVGWLLILFVAEAYTGTVLRAFEEQLEAAIALAFFIPLLIGTGGNSGTQITTTIVRAMAVGEVSMRNLGTVLKKELSTGLLISAAIAVAAWIRAWSLGVGPEIGMVVTLAIIAIVLWSATVASIIPMVLRRFRIDPAVVSAPFIATLVDGTGLIIYFEMAKWLLPELQ
ncbi:magnesium transporter [Aeromonas salmonicida]|uniref:magnesium transporter n=1 Tax=Aeromonas salmonicida TaxID=645 RepID=UPI0009BFD130|nr:magnesium transporter [Aeromonas salmonicida]